jgi:hypothetical protein
MKEFKSVSTLRLGIDHPGHVLGIERLHQGRFHQSGYQSFGVKIPGINFSDKGSHPIAEFINLGKNPRFVLTVHLFGHISFQRFIYHYIPKQIGI